MKGNRHQGLDQVEGSKGNGQRGADHPAPRRRYPDRRRSRQGSTFFEAGSEIEMSVGISDRPGATWRSSRTG